MSTSLFYNLIFKSLTKSSNVTKIDYEMRVRKENYPYFLPVHFVLCDSTWELYDTIYIDIHICSYDKNWDEMTRK